MRSKRTEIEAKKAKPCTSQSPSELINDLMNAQERAKKKERERERTSFPVADTFCAGARETTRLYIS